MEQAPQVPRLREKEPSLEVTTQNYSRAKPVPETIEVRHPGLHTLRPAVLQLCQLTLMSEITGMKGKTI